MSAAATMADASCRLSALDDRTVTIGFLVGSEHDFASEHGTSEFSRVAVGARPTTSQTKADGILNRILCNNTVQIRRIGVVNSIRRVLLVTDSKLGSLSEIKSPPP